MKRSIAHTYTLLGGVFLLLQGTITLAFRLSPRLDAICPQVLSTTRMMPAHSSLHIASGIVALALFAFGGRRGVVGFSAGFGAFYVALAVYGWLAGDPTFLHLQPFDHAFHLAFGSLGMLAAWLTVRAARRERSTHT